MLPDLFVFDLDDTVWAGDVDIFFKPPFGLDLKRKQQVDGLPLYPRLKDSRQSPFECFPDSLSIIQWIGEQGVDVAFASRTTTPKDAQQALTQLLVPRRGASHLTGDDVLDPRVDNRYVDLASLSVYSAWGDVDKKRHLKEIEDATGVEFKNMLFFDNEKRNITSAKRLGVPCCWCRDGLSWAVFKEAIRQSFSSD
ncbi:MAG: uncharacterized protein KVP18_000322 [Porospora cf. gigantea A]|uniref:uncharacterized protein n=1 Tax=Porospora cf. gigantea A TaxID=2853593 RepID=UPI0035596136|nr:MAG: hypothetical protein KVP18_000322 [Porospora cf. gigantea A]